MRIAFWFFMSVALFNGVAWAQDGRTTWMSNDQQNTYIKEGPSTWIENRTETGSLERYRFGLVNSNGSFVELRDAGRGISVRLFADQIAVHTGRGIYTNWRFWKHGSWR